MFRKKRVSHISIRTLTKNIVFVTTEKMIYSNYFSFLPKIYLKSTDSTFSKKISKKNGN